MRLAPLMLVLASCGSPSPAPERVTYANTIAALVRKRCFECHGPKSPTMEEFDKNKQAFKRKNEVTEAERAAILAPRE